MYSCTFRIQVKVHLGTQQENSVVNRQKLGVVAALKLSDYNFPL